MSEKADQTSAIRAFNRFYTKVIGLLDDGIMKSPFALAEARIIHEIGKLERTTSAALARALGMDPGQLSRLVSRLTERNVIAAAPNREDARAADLTLTSTGRAACSELNSLSDAAAAELLAPLGPPQRQALVAAMQTITGLVGGATTHETTFRDHRIGDLGWLIHRQGRLYHEEHGWNGEFEALIAEIYAEFEMALPPPSKRLWIAERHGAIAGSVFVLPSAADQNVAQLRMLYVEPWARGSGLGHRLVGEVVSFSRAAGYGRVMLWTQDCLTAARSVYKAAGFTLMREERHHSFGKDLNGQFWELDLDGRQSGAP
jgi:DNA-binding MarR family transcriptional regulator/N-acetylglutamate synthase-like GNAT family acetyltransferase